MRLLNNFYTKNEFFINQVINPRFLSSENDFVLICLRIFLWLYCLVFYVENLLLGTVWEKIVKHNLLIVCLTSLLHYFSFRSPRLLLLCLISLVLFWLINRSLHKMDSVIPIASCLFMSKFVSHLFFSWFPLVLHMTSHLMSNFIHSLSLFLTLLLEWYLLSPEK